jgi:hypothetical protein
VGDLKLLFPWALLVTGGVSTFSESMSIVSDNPVFFSPSKAYSCFFFAWLWLCCQQKDFDTFGRRKGSFKVSMIPSKNRDIILH